MGSPAGDQAFTIRRLATADAPAYRDLRLEGLRDRPEAFGGTWSEEEAQPLAWFAARLDDLAVFGGHGPGGTLDGILALRIPETEKLRHHGMLLGMFVRPAAQGRGLGSALLARVLDHASGLVEAVRLTVVASNQDAVRLYRRAGFVAYGRDERALKVGGRYYDELLMGLALREAPRPPARPAPPGA